MARSPSPRLLPLPCGGRGGGSFRRERLVLGLICLIVTLSLWSYNQRYFVGDDPSSTIFTLTPKTFATQLELQQQQQQPSLQRVEFVVERSLDDATKQALAAEFAICRATQLQQVPSVSSQAAEFNTDINLGTSCQEDPTYQAFTDKLLWQASLDHTNDKQPTSLWWGRYHNHSFANGRLPGAPFPPNANILLVGSKNAAQVAQIWACQVVSSSAVKSFQQGDQHLGLTPLESVMTVDQSSDHMVTLYTFPSINSTLTVVADSYFVYASNDNHNNTGEVEQQEFWHILLEEQLQRAFAEIYPSQQQQHRLARLENMDALVLGLFQECSANDKTKFTKKMLQATQTYAPSVNCLNNSTTTVSSNSNSPPNIAQWTRAMRQGAPIAFLTFPMTDKAYLASQYYWEMRQFMEHQSEQKTESSPQALPALGLIDARRFRNKLADTCPSYACKQGGGSTRRPCIGEYGSYTDTVVWDIVEFLYAHLQLTEPQSQPQPVENGNLDDGKNERRTAPTSASAFDVRPALPSNHSSSSCPPPTLLRINRAMCSLPYVSTPSEDRFAQPVHIDYQCAGPDYDVFGQNLQTYIYKKISAAAENSHSLAATPAQNHEEISAPPYLLMNFSSWGRRSVPIPAGKRLLIVGNSHTRQMAYAMLCMHADSIKGMVELSNGGANAAPMRLEFCHNAQIVTAFNSYFPYSQDWQSLLEKEVIKEPLENFDAVVVGLFNHCGGENSFTRDMMRKTANMPHVDCVNTPPPTMLQWAQAYPKGALIFVSMFANNLRNDRNVAVQHIQQLRQSNSNTTNVVHFVDGRQHIDTMQQECACPNRTHAEDCDELVVNSDPDYPAHRCVGEHGGHPDLVAWDVMEHLHSLLGERSL